MDYLPMLTMALLLAVIGGKFYVGVTIQKAQHIDRLKETPCKYGHKSPNFQGVIKIGRSDWI